MAKKNTPKVTVESLKSQLEEERTKHKREMEEADALFSELADEYSELADDFVVALEKHERATAHIKDLKAHLEHHHKQIQRIFARDFDKAMRLIRMGGDMRRMYREHSEELSAARAKERRQYHRAEFWQIATLITLGLGIFIIAATV